MNQFQYDNLSKLCEALESGRYTQGRDVLRSTNNLYCCLGVAIDIVQPDKWHLYRNKLLGNCYSHPLGSYQSNGVKTQDPKIIYLDTAGMEMYGFTEDDIGHLTDLNDNGSSFADISIYIRNNIMIRFTNEEVSQ